MVSDTISNNTNVHSTPSTLQYICIEMSVYLQWRQKYTTSLQHNIWNSGISLETLFCNAGEVSLLILRHFQEWHLRKEKTSVWIAMEIRLWGPRRCINQNIIYLTKILVRSWKILLNLVCSQLNVSWAGSLAIREMTNAHINFQVKVWKLQKGSKSKNTNPARATLY